MRKIENRILMLAVCALVTVLLIAGILLPDKGKSLSERRTLAKLPKLAAENLMDGSWFDDMEDYLADQFPAREWFRRLKAAGNYKLLGLKENNGYYLAGEHLGKLDYPLKESSVSNAAVRFKKVAELFGEAVCYYTIIPDKNYYLAPEYGLPSMDYKKMEDILAEELPQMKYLPIFECFKADDYYTTDLHIRQEAWSDAADLLLEGMENAYRTSRTNFVSNEVPGFYGAWYGQAAVAMPSDTIKYLESPAILAAEVYDHEAQKKIHVYSEKALSGDDKYDYFLSGARAFLTITCPEAKTDRELILVRDSFGSSLAPVILEGYQKITLVDLRYIASDLLPKYIEVSEKCDVLFALNAGIYNSSSMLK